MIYDKENMFFDEKACSSFSATPAYSDVVANGEGGAAYPNAAVDVRVSGAQLAGGTLDIELETAADEAFTSPTFISATKTFTTAMAIGDLHDVMHIGPTADKFLRLKATGSASITGDAKITAGIVIDHEQK